MNLYTRFKRLFNIDYQVKFRNTVFELNLEIAKEEKRRYVLVNRQGGVEEDRALINLLVNQFTNIDQVFEHITARVHGILIEYLDSKAIPTINTEDQKINWQAILESLDGLKTHRNEKERIKGIFSQLQIVSDNFGFSAKWVI